MAGELESDKEIKRHVDRLLRAADAYGRFPTPVEDIVSAAQLIEADDYVLDDAAINEAPEYLRSLLRSAKHKIQGLVDRRARVIQISPNIDNEGKRRFVTLHETTHTILPHQRDLLYADDHETLSPKTNRLFEREANRGAAELLFQRDRFTHDARDLAISIASIRGLAAQYGSSFHAAFRRYVETHDEAVAGIVIRLDKICDEPPTWRREEFMSTARWERKAGPANWPLIMDGVAYPFLSALDFGDIDHVRVAGPGDREVRINVDVLTTHYKHFVLLSVPSRRRLLPAKKLRLTTVPS